MIYECAIDPEFFLEIARDKAMRITLANTFKPGTPYVRSDYPGNFADIVLASLNRRLEVAKESEKPAIKKLEARAVALLNNLRYSKAKRFNARKWDGNFRNEEKRQPFYAILADKDCCNGKKITWAMLNDEDTTPFTHAAGIRVERQPEEMGKALAPLLGTATDITFIEPYFAPSDQFKRTYVLFFKKISGANKVRAEEIPRVVSIICSYRNILKMEYKNLDEFREICLNFLPSWLPADLSLKIHVIQELPAKQEIHNRYILTNIGGVMLGHGTDSSKGRERHTRDDINLLGERQYQELRAIYKQDSSEFEWKETIIVGSNP